MRLDVIKKIVFKDEYDKYNSLTNDIIELEDRYNLCSNDKDKDSLLDLINAKYDEASNAINPDRLDKDIVDSKIYDYIMNTDSGLLNENGELFETEDFSSIESFEKVRNNEYVKKHLDYQARSGRLKNMNFFDNMIDICNNNFDEFDSITNIFDSIDDFNGSDYSEVLSYVFLNCSYDGIDKLIRACNIGYDVYGKNPIVMNMNSKAKKYDTKFNTGVILNSIYDDFSDIERCGLIIFPEVIYDEDNNLRSVNNIRNILIGLEEERNDIEGSKDTYNEYPISSIERYHINKVNADNKKELWDSINYFFETGKIRIKK